MGLQGEHGIYEIDIGGRAPRGEGLGRPVGVGQLQVCAMALAFVDVSELNVGDNTVIIGHREAVMALLTGSPAQRLEAALGTDILPGLASTLTPGTDDGVSAETF